MKHLFYLMSIILLLVSACKRDVARTNKEYPIKVEVTIRNQAAEDSSKVTAYVTYNDSIAEGEPDTTLYDITLGKGLELHRKKIDQKVIYEGSGSGLQGMSEQLSLLSKKSHNFKVAVQLPRLESFTVVPRTNNSSPLSVQWKGNDLLGDETLTWIIICNNKTAIGNVQGPSTSHAIEIKPADILHLPAGDGQIFLVRTHNTQSKIRGNEIVVRSEFTSESQQVVIKK